MMSTLPNLIFKKIHPIFSGVVALWKFGHFELVSKISRKVFELGAWNLVSWQGMMSRLPNQIKKKKYTLFFRSYGPLKIWAF